MPRLGRFWSRAAQALAPRVEYWNLRFICNLPARRLFGGVLGICDFRHKTSRQSRISLSAVVARLLSGRRSRCYYGGVGWRSRRPDP